MWKVGRSLAVLTLFTGGLAMVAPAAAKACGRYRATVEVSREQAREQAVRASFEAQGRTLTGLTVVREGTGRDGGALVFVSARFRTSAGVFSQRLGLSPPTTFGGVVSRGWTVVPVLRGPVRSARVS